MTKILQRSRIIRYAILLMALFFSQISATDIHAESTATSEWDISADKITRYSNPDRIEAEGNIVLTKREKIPPVIADAVKQSAWSELLEEHPPEEELITPERLENAANAEPEYKTAVTIRTDWMSYDTGNKSILARGNVVVDTGEDAIYADEASINLDNETGELSRAVVIRQDMDLHLEGRRLTKTGTKTYTIDDGWVITCKLEDGQKPPWSFSSSRADITQGGYAILHNAKFNIKSTPILYSPVLIVPVKDTRQTGLLFPGISMSDRDGFQFNLPLFINISDSIDATLFTDYRTERGVKEGLDFRYMLSDTDQGRFTIDYLKDALSDPDETGYYADTGYTHTNDDRYWIRGKVDQTFGNDWITRLDIDIVSDQDYLDEFRSGFTGLSSSQASYLRTFGRGFESRGDYYRENSFNLYKSWSTSSLSAKLLAIDDIRENIDKSDALWQLPSIDYSGDMPIMDSSFLFQWNADYVNYWREEGVGGQRVDLYPRVSVPVPLGPYLESSAEVGIRETMYSLTTYGDADWAYADDPTRTLGTFKMDLATTLVRDFGKETEKSSPLRHSVRPFVEYNYIAGDDEESRPSFDSVDDIEEANGITYGIDNYFYFKDGDGDFTVQKLYFNIEQTYSFLDEDEDNRFSEVTLEVGGSPFDALTFSYQAGLPVDEDQNTTHDIDAYFRTSRGDRFTLEYSYDEDSNIEQINAYLTARIHPVLQAGLGIEHSLSEGETDEGYVALTYIQQCWSVQLKEYHTSTEDKITVLFTLANIGQPFGLDF